MIGYREWAVRRTRDGLLLYSLAQPIPWGVRLTADETPSVGNGKGIHAFLPWSTQASKPPCSMNDYVTVLGAVDLYGIVQVHEDGIVRGEHARILALRVVHPRPMYHVALPFGRDATYCNIAYCSCDVRMSSQELEEALLQQYGVPRLPDGVGPWPTPIGTGPVPMEV